MSKVDKKLPNDEAKLREIAKNTDNPQLKRAVEKRLADSDKPILK